MVASVRYRVNGDNSVLRLVLQELYKSKCYWCTRPRDYADLQIDHIVPQTADAARLAEVAGKAGLSGFADVHDVGNLAPICGHCNQQKTDAYLADVPRFYDLLLKAWRRRQAVIDAYELFGRSTKVAKALLAAAEADLSDDAARDTFMAHAPAVARRLAMLGEDVSAYAPIPSVSVPIDDGPQLDVEIVLDSPSRRAQTVFQDVCGAKWEAILDGPMADAFEQILKRLQSEMEADGEYGEPSNAGYPTSDYVRMDVDLLEFTRSGDVFEFTIGVAFEVSASASVVRNDTWGEGLQELQGDGYVDGTCSFVATWDTESESWDIGEPEIDAWKSSIHIIP